MGGGGCPPTRLSAARSVVLAHRCARPCPTRRPPSGRGGHPAGNGVGPRRSAQWGRGAATRENSTSGACVASVHDVEGAVRGAVVYVAPMIRLRPVVLAFVAFVVALACGTATFVVQQYTGEPLPRHLVAVLRLEGGDDALVVSLDGEVLENGRLDPGTRVLVELLPGEHEVGLIKVSSEARVVQAARFRAEQGKYYRARVADRPPSEGSRRSLQPGLLWAPYVWEIDRDTDEWLVDVTMPPKPDAPQPAPSTSATGAPTASAAASIGAGGASSESSVGGRPAVGAAPPTSSAGSMGSAGRASAVPAPSAGSASTPAQ